MRKTFFRTWFTAFRCWRDLSEGKSIKKYRFYIQIYEYLAVEKQQGFYLIYKQLQDKGGYAAIDSNEQVDGSQNHISCTGNSEDKGCWVHKWSDGPPKDNKIDVSIYSIYNHIYNVRSYIRKIYQTKV